MQAFTQYNKHEFHILLNHLPVNKTNRTFHPLSKIFQEDEMCHLALQTIFPQLTTQVRGTKAGYELSHSTTGRGTVADSAQRIYTHYTRIYQTTQKHDVCIYVYIHLYTHVHGWCVWLVVVYVVEQRRV